MVAARIALNLLSAGVAPVHSAWIWYVLFPVRATAPPIVRSGTSDVDCTTPVIGTPLVTSQIRTRDVSPAADTICTTSSRAVTDFGKKYSPRTRQPGDVATAGIVRAGTVQAATTSAEDADSTAKP